MPCRGMMFPASWRGTLTFSCPVPGKARWKGQRASWTFLRPGTVRRWTLDPLPGGPRKGGRDRQFKLMLSRSLRL